MIILHTHTHTHSKICKKCNLKNWKIKIEKNVRNVKIINQY